MPCVSPRFDSIPLRFSMFYLPYIGWERERERKRERERACECMYECVGQGENILK